MSEALDWRQSTKPGLETINAAAGKLGEALGDRRSWLDS
jgi:hypothetical protein